MHVERSRRSRHSLRYHRFIVSSWLGVGFTLVALALLPRAGWTDAAPAASPAPVNAPESRVLIEFDGTAQSLKNFVVRLRSAGTEVSHVFVPSFLIVENPPTDLSSWNGVLNVYRESIPLGAQTGRGLTERVVIDVWNATLSPAAQDEPPSFDPDPSMGAMPADAKHKPTDVYALAPLSLENVPYGAGFYDTSEYLMGSVAVGIFIMESNAGSYDWSDAEVSQTTLGVYQGMDFWRTQGGAAAHLTFFYELHVRVPTIYEPIEIAHGDEQLWISEAMASLGYNTGNPWYDVTAYNNDLRSALGTDWAYSLFIVYSDPTVDLGRFPDGGYAWAYFGGPWISMARYCTWAYNFSNYFKAVPAHEMGHIFYATDEYDGYLQYSGYLNIVDRNNVTCLMNQNSLTGICANSKQQVGWRDTDADGIHDILDTPPQTTLLSYPVDPTPVDVITFNGSAVVTTYPNLNPYGPRNNITLNTISGVENRVSGGAWGPSTATDGAFGEPEEQVTFAVDLPNCGPNTIELRAVNSVGNSDPTPASDMVSLNAPEAMPVDVAATDDQCDRVTVSWNWAGAGQQGFDVYRDGQLVHTSNDINLRTWDDTNAALGETYDYSVAVINECGAGPVSAEDVGGLCYPVATLFVNFGAHRDVSAIRVHWATLEADPALRFKVYRAEGTATAQQIDVAVDHSAEEYWFEDSGVDPAVSYRYRVVALAADEGLASFEVVVAPIQVELVLEQNHPNPFNPTTTIGFVLPEAGPVELEVFDVAGKVVSTVVKETLPAGRHSFDWNGRMENGESASSGIYVYRLRTPAGVVSRKMTLLK
jgi:FlgD Ig-like domain